LANDSETNRACKLETQLLNPDGKEVKGDIEAGAGGNGLPVGSDSQTVEIPAHSTKTIEMRIGVPAARLWSPDTPNLYRAVSTVSQAGNVIDTHDATFGIRSISVSADKGLLLNGQRVLLCGGCVHHDNGGLGAAAFDRAEVRRVELLKAAGFNAIRTSHNPPSPQFLDACDRLGILVIDEFFDVWDQSKETRQDYSVYFKDWWQRDLEAAITRDRNHPCVFCWSIGNEIGNFGGPHGRAIGTALIEGVRKLDQTRLIDSSISNWNDAEALLAKLDFVGYNYQASLYPGDHRKFPSRVMCATESFPRDVFNGWAQAADRTYVLGDFVWTAIDYLGESGIGRYYYPGQRNARQAGRDQFPYHGANCGDFDITGFRKPVSHYRNIVWDRGERLYVAVQEPTPDGRPIRASGWALVPSHASWTWPGYEGKSLNVQVYSRCDSVRLYLNDKLIGENPTTRGEQFKAVFSVPYAAGVLKAVGIQSGMEAQTVVLKTAGLVAGLRLTPDRATITADGEDLSFIAVESVDDDGNFQPNGDQAVSFKVSGAGAMAAVASGDLSGTEGYQDHQRRLFHGRAQIIVRAAGHPRSGSAAGEIEVKAKAEGLRDASAIVKTIAPHATTPRTADVRVIFEPTDKKN
jgi:beta-galactosidase